MNKAKVLWTKFITFSFKLSFVLAVLSAIVFILASAITEFIPEISTMLNIESDKLAPVGAVSAFAALIGGIALKLSSTLKQLQISSEAYIEEERLKAKKEYDLAKQETDARLKILEDRAQEEMSTLHKSVEVQKDRIKLDKDKLKHFSNKNYRG